MATSSEESSNSESSYESDELEIDGFPSEQTNNTRFTSLQSTNNGGSVESLCQNRTSYMAMNSWSLDTLPEELLKNCVVMLRNPSSVTSEDRNRLLEKLESHIYVPVAGQQMDSLSKFSSISQKSPPFSIGSDSKSQFIKVTVELPSTTPTATDVKYSIIKPTFDKQNSCWKTGMEFLLRDMAANRTTDTIDESEENNDIFFDEKGTQVDDEKQFPSVPDNFAVMPKPIDYNTRSRSADKLFYTDVLNVEQVPLRVSSEIDISYLEKFEGSFQEIEEKNFLVNFRSSFRYYKNTIQRALERLKDDAKRVKLDSESLFQSNYELFSENHFKRYCQNQLLLIDIEQQISLVNSEINKKDVHIEKVHKTCSADDLEVQKELKKTKFAYSVRLINQMSKILKEQVTGLTNEIKSLQSGISTIKL